MWVTSSTFANKSVSHHIKTFWAISACHYGQTGKECRGWARAEERSNQKKRRCDTKKRPQRKEFVEEIHQTRGRKPRLRPTLAPHLEGGKTEVSQVTAGDSVIDGNRPPTMTRGASNADNQGPAKHSSPELPLPIPHKHIHSTTDWWVCLVWRRGRSPVTVLLTCFLAENKDGSGSWLVYKSSTPFTTIATMTRHWLHLKKNVLFWSLNTPPEITLLSRGCLECSSCYALSLKRKKKPVWRGYIIFLPQIVLVYLMTF